jgi:alanine racemase
MQVANLFDIDKQFYPTTEALIQHLPSLSFKNECILLKGARIFGFERIASVLQKKTHETVLEIQLSAMVHNLNFYRSKLKSGVKTMAMVKAFSYGSGSFEVANMLQFNGVDYLAVAYADEGIELRQAGISLPILVLSPEVDSFPAMIENRLEPEIYSFRMLELYSAAAISRNGFDGQPLRIHIKFDTGMHRLGFEEADIPQLINQLQATPHLDTVAVFSHLAASGDSEHAAFTHEQISRFDRCSKALELGLDKTLIKHLLNSSGITNYYENQYDMVRLGIGLYGIGDENDQDSLLPVSTLLTSISQIRKLNAGETVGYSRKGILNKPSRIATLPIGYADGFLRKLGNGNAKLRVQGIEAPTIGNICMDMCMIDVTNIPSAKEGDQVVIFENAQDIRTMAKWLDTIPYEVLTGISERVKRVYFQE